MMTVCAGVVLSAVCCIAPGRAADTSTAPALLGTWRDGHADLLPPGVAHFEAVHSDLVLAADGRFTLTVDKAAGALRQTGYYTVRGDVLTLNYPSASASYGFSCVRDGLTLQDQGTSSAKPIMLRQVPAH